jgi:hypothetical protein
MKAKLKKKKTKKKISVKQTITEKLGAPKTAKIIME